MRAGSRRWRALLLLAGCAHDKPDPPPAWSLRSAATAHLRALARIGERNRDTRAAGTPGYDASVDYVAGRLRSAGYRVRLQAVPFPVFRDRSRPRLEAGGRRLPVLTLRYSGPGRVRAPVARVGLGCRAADLAGARGRIAIAERGTLHVPREGAHRAGRGRARAGGRRRRERRAGARLADPARARHPLGGGGARGAEAARAARELVVDTVAATERTRNVIAERPGAGGAWRWSAPTSTPCARGRGSTTTAAAWPSRSRWPSACAAQRGLRFAFWGAEELGLYGSRRYVDSLSAEGAQARSRATSTSTWSARPTRCATSTARAACATRWSEALRARKLRFESITIGESSDHAPFAGAGIPAGGLYSGSEERKTATRRRPTAAAPAARSTPVTTSAATCSSASTATS